LLENLNLEVVVSDLCALARMTDPVHSGLTDLDVELVQAKNDRAFQYKRRQGVQQAHEQHLHGLGNVELWKLHAVLEVLEKAVNQIRCLVQDCV
jgi:hypothetical protein